MKKRDHDKAVRQLEARHQKELAAVIGLLTEELNFWKAVALEELTKTPEVSDYPTKKE